MVSFHHIVQGILPFSVFPYTVASLFVISYYTYLKYKNWREIRNVPPYKFKKSLQLKSIVYSFILILSVAELAANLSMQTSLILQFDLKQYIHRVTVSKSCVIKDRDLASLNNKSTFLIERALDVGVAILTMFPITMSLFYVILRCIYINYPYHQHVRKYILYIVMQFILKVTTTCFLQTRYFEQLILFPLTVIDVGIYISTSHKFYLLLKGRRNGARIHSSERDYLMEEQTAQQFFFARAITLFAFSLLIIGTFLSFISVPLDLFGHNPCFLSYISLGYFPDIKISRDLRTLSQSITYYCFILELISAFIGEVLGISIYMALSIGIIIDLIKRHRRFIYINDAIKPLMIKYRNRR